MGTKNKLACLFQASFFKLEIYFLESKSRAFMSKPSTLALRLDIRLIWEGLQVTNTLAYSAPLWLKK